MMASFTTVYRCNQNNITYQLYNANFLLFRRKSVLTFRMKILLVIDYSNSTYKSSVGAGVFTNAVLDFVIAPPVS